MASDCVPFQTKEFCTFCNGDEVLQVGIPFVNEKGLADVAKLGVMLYGVSAVPIGESVKRARVQVFDLTNFQSHPQRS